MAQQVELVGENMPSVELLDMDSRTVNTMDWKGAWTILVFLRHLG
jgi:peroxiredoxin